MRSSGVLFQSKNWSLMGTENAPTRKIKFVSGLGDRIQMKKGCCCSSANSSKFQSLLIILQYFIIFHIRYFRTCVVLSSLKSFRFFTLSGPGMMEVCVCVCVFAFFLFCEMNVWCYCDLILRVEKYWNIVFTSLI